jgi:hypothetical protein
VIKKFAANPNISTAYSLPDQNSGGYGWGFVLKYIRVEITFMVQFLHQRVHPQPTTVMSTELHVIHPETCMLRCITIVVAV